MSLLRPSLSIIKEIPYRLLADDKNVTADDEETDPMLYTTGIVRLWYLATLNPVLYSCLIGGGILGGCFFIFWSHIKEAWDRFYFRCRYGNSWGGEFADFEMNRGTNVGIGLA